MKMPLLLLVLATVASVAAREHEPAGFYEGYTGFALPAEPVLPAHEVHPSLWFRAGGIPALKARLTTDEFSRTRWAAILRHADLASPPPPAPAASDPTERIHRYYGSMSMAARAHALAALLLDGPAAGPHRRRAIDLLLRAYDGPIFELDANIKGSPVDEIYRGSWLQNYAAAYDCLQSQLTPAEDAAIRARLAREAECVYENLYRWTPTSPHNHLSKPAWGLGSIALAMSGDPRARAWLRRALEASNRNTRYFFSGDGLYREGGHYLVFSLTNFVPFLYHYRNVSGVDGFPVFQPVFEAMVATRNSRGWLPNIEDSYLRPTPTQLVAGAYRHARTWLNASAPLAEILAWSYETCDLAPFEHEHADSGFNYTGASWDYPLAIDELLTRDPSIRATAPDVTPDVFLAGGQTVFRSGWTDAGSGQRYLLFHGVAVADNHNHDDQLSFILEAEGQMMCSDSGYSRGTYAGAERTAWYNTAPAHNTLTFDGRPADQEPTNRTPPVSFRTDAPGLAGEEKTAYFGQQATWRRAIFRIAEDYFVVIDRVDAKQPGKVTGFLHGGRGTLTREGARHTWHYAADRYGRAASLHAWIAAPGTTISEKSGELTYIKGDYASYPYLEMAAPAFTSPWVTLLEPAAENAAPAYTVDEQQAGPRTILSVRRNRAERTLIAAALSPSPVTLDDIETDAAVVLVRQAGDRVLNYCALEATYLRVAGREIWHSDQRASAAGP